MRGTAGCGAPNNGSKMPKIELLSVTARTVALLLAPDSNLFWLPEPVDWHLSDGQGHLVESGSSDRVPLFLEGLEPAQTYSLRTPFGTATFRMKPCPGAVSVTDHGASPDLENNAPAFARAIAALPPGGTLIVPPGHYRSGPIFLRSDMTLYLPNLARLAALSDRTDWPILAAHDKTGRNISTWEGLPEPSFAAPVTAIGCENLTITGQGCIDGGGAQGDWWDWPKETRQGARRPRTIFLSHCSNVTLTGLRVCNSPSWTVHPFRCNDITAAAMSIENPANSPNTDGFNPESCENTRISGLRISVGDDCIAVKAGKRLTDQPEKIDHLAPTRHLTIANCLMEFGHGAVVLGSEMSGDITDVTITRCQFDGTDRGLRIKTRRGRGGVVRRVTLDHVEMDGVATPLAINAFYFCDADGKSDAVQSRSPATVDQTTPQVSEITLKNVVARHVHHAAIAILGLPEAPFSNIRIDGFQVSFDPDATAGEPLMACGVTPVRHVEIIREFAELTGTITPVSPKELAAC